MKKAFFLAATLSCFSSIAMASTTIQIHNNDFQGYSGLWVSINPGEKLILNSNSAPDVFQNYIFSTNGACTGSFISGSKVELTYQPISVAPEDYCIINSHMGDSYQAPGFFSIKTEGATGGDHAYYLNVMTKKVMVRPNYPLPVPYFFYAG
ncbi:MAG: hypothetical protein NTZ67_03830 [Gammaproteobacteria bacterium]|nr:hypothetical protein [Gammaproteobacteria bacterium]